MVREGVQGRIVFVASVLAYFSLVGYAPYSPGKFAVRGLAEALHSEFVLYGLGVHLCLPGTIFTPGYAAENEVKPKITLKLEEADAGAQPEHVAAQLLRGVERGRFHITYDFIGNVFRASTRGSSPGNHGLLDGLYNLIGAVRGHSDCAYDDAHVLLPCRSRCRCGDGMSTSRSGLTRASTTNICAARASLRRHEHMHIDTSFKGFFSAYR